MLKFNILLYNFFKIDPKIFVDSCRYYIFECILFSSSFFKTINHHSVFLFIHDPVLPDSCILILIQLSIIIHLPAGRRNDFNNPIRRSIASFFCNLIFITNHTDCRQLKILSSVKAIFCSSKIQISIPKMLVYHYYTCILYFKQLHWFNFRENLNLFNNSILKSFLCIPKDLSPDWIVFLMFSPIIVFLYE